MIMSRPNPGDPPPINNLFKPMYTMQMGWRRWTWASRRRWVSAMIFACRRTIKECEIWLEENQDKQDPPRRWNGFQNRRPSQEAL